MKIKRQISLILVPFIITAVTLILLCAKLTSFKHSGHIGIRERLIRQLIADYEEKDSIFYSYLFMGLIDSAAARYDLIESRDNSNPNLSHMEMYLELYRKEMLAEHTSKSGSYDIYRNFLESECGADAANPIGFFLNMPYTILRLTSNSIAERYPRFINDNLSIVYIADVEAESYDDGLFLDKRLYGQEVRIAGTRTGVSSVLPISETKRIYTCLNTVGGGNRIIFSYKNTNPDSARSRKFGTEKIALISMEDYRPVRDFPDNINGHSPIMISDSLLIYIRRTINILNIANYNITRSPERDPEWSFFMDNIDYGGGLIVFRGLANVKRWQICYTDTNFTRIVRVTGYYERANYPTISSDGRYIAYLKEQSNGEDEIFLYSISDSTEVRISDSGGTKAGLSFSDDDSYLIFCQKPINKPDSYFDIYCMNLKQRTTAVELLAYLDSMKNNGYE